MNTDASEPGALPVPPPVPLDDPRITELRQLLAIIDTLRAPGGCPWDAEQTQASMAPCVVEEAHELVDAIESGGVPDRAAEAGDVLTALALVCRIAEDDQDFDLGVAAKVAATKLVRRHPHVFAESGAKGPGEVPQSWEQIKRSEREEDGSDTSALAGVPHAMPALQLAGRVCQKAVGAGFHWKDARGALAKLEEELDELREVLPVEWLASAARPKVPGGEARARIEHELGDVMMAAAFLGGYLGLDPEAMCRVAVKRFDTRFRFMEEKLGGTLEGRSLDEMLAQWNLAKEVTQ